jgi:tRNA-dihydrouridine synthase
VIANGDIKTSEEALKVLDATGAVGVSIGRASIGNPYVFSELRNKSSHSFNQLNREIQPLWLLLDYVQAGKTYAIGSEFSQAKHFLYVHLKDASKKQILREQLDSIETLEEFLAHFIPKYPALAQHPLAKNQ